MFLAIKENNKKKRKKKNIANSIPYKNFIDFCF